MRDGTIGADGLANVLIPKQGCIQGHCGSGPVSIPLGLPLGMQLVKQEDNHIKRHKTLGGKQDGAAVLDPHGGKKVGSRGSTPTVAQKVDGRMVEPPSESPRPQAVTPR